MTEQQYSAINSEDNPVDPAADPWRSEVQARIAGYKKRRGRRVEGAFSMRFPFPAEEFIEPLDLAPVPEMAGHSETVPAEDLISRATTEHPLASATPRADSTERVKDAVAENDNVTAEHFDLVLGPTPEPEPEPFVDRAQRPRPKRKVIAFPSHLSVAPPTVYRLADPVTAESPRILDVPEELEAIPTTPFLDGLQLDRVDPADEARNREHVDLPFRAVRVSRRVVAGLIDVTAAGIGVALFIAVVLRILAKPPLTKPLILGLAVATSLLWSVYQYLFVVYAGKTLGMMATKVRLRTFQGQAPTMRQRRHRVLGFFFSVLSLGMGLMWSFVDVDSLCWHDRLSQTYLADRQ